MFRRALSVLQRGWRERRCVGLGSQVQPEDLARLGFSRAELWQRRRAWTAYRQRDRCILFHGPLWHGSVGHRYGGRECSFALHHWRPVSCRLTCPFYAGDPTPHCATVLAHATCMLHPLHTRAFVAQAAQHQVAVRPAIWDVAGAAYDLD